MRRATMCNNHLHPKDYTGLCKPCKAATHRRWRLNYPEVWNNSHRNSQRYMRERASATKESK